MQNYLDLLARVILDGETRPDRTGVGTKSIFGLSLEYDLRQGFPLVTTKNVPFKSVAAELAGFLEGTQSATRMRELGTNIWNLNANGDNLGPIYGAVWRKWGEVDQLQSVADQIVLNPYSRRHLVSAWDVGRLPEMCLPPCHTHFQLYVSTSLQLSCAVYMRSVDLFLGAPFDIASYALLLHIIARDTRYTPSKLVLFFGDAHVYLNHFTQAKLQCARKPKGLPTLLLEGDNVSINNFKPEDARLVGYDPYSKLYAPLNT